MNFAEKLKELRSKKGISQAALAKAIHISRSAVAKWENGLGLPGDDSLHLLSNYFDVSEEELMSDKETEHSSVSINRTVSTQSTVIIVLACLFAAVLIAVGLTVSKTLQECFSLIFIGLVCVALGAFNMRGNIASIHWYNRRKVTMENQLPYCRLVGIGTVTVGAGMLLSAAAQIIMSRMGEYEAAALWGGALTIAGIAVGLALILYAQFKYNKGIF